MSDISDAINTNAQSPRRASGDSGSVEQQSLLDQIAADKYLASRTASQTTALSGLRLFKISPPGAI